jgi:deoxyribose-phosphate aldolase
MFTEIIVKDRCIKKSELQEFFFHAVNGGLIDNLCLPTSMIHYFSAIHGYVNIVGVIDYPYGLTCSKTRVADIDYAVKSGCKTIDLVLNHSYIENDDLDLIEKDIRYAQTILAPKNLELRAVVDYRLIEPKLRDLCGILFSLGVTSIVSSTGTLSDDTIDNLIVANDLRKLGMNVIVCGVTRNKEDFQMMQTQGISGVRFSSLESAKRILNK